MKKHLGKGIEALLSEIVPPIIEQQIPQQEQNVSKFNIEYIEIEKLKPSKWQPRSIFNEDSLKQLAESIKHSGIIEPLVVSPLEDGNYEIVCGERRWRAAQMAQLKQVPAIVKTLDEKQKHIFSLVENLQREDLNPVEEAEAYKKLIEEYNLTQEELSKFIGKDRSVIANTLRILSLPQEVINFVRDGLISAGHARVLAGIKQTELIIELVNKIVQDKLTVRDLENISKVLKQKSHIKQKKSIAEIPEIKQLQKELSEILHTKVTIKPTTNTKGKIIIHYKNLDDFDNILKVLKNKKI